MKETSARFVCPPDHAHGKTATCWGNTKHKCRCDECREAQRKRLERRRKDVAYGRHEFTRSATPVRRHVNTLRGQGWTVRDIARAADVSAQTVNRAGLGIGGGIKAESARRILAVRASDKPAADMGGRLVDATGTVRRFQALVYMGYPGADLMRRMGMNPAYVSHLVNHVQVVEATRAKVAALYDELWSTPPTPTDAQAAYHMRRAQAWARRRGWVGPLHWDSIDTDPEPVTILPDTDRAGWVIDELDMLREAGESAVSAAALLRRNVKSTASLAFRHGRPDLGRWLEEAA